MSGVCLIRGGVIDDVTCIGLVGSKQTATIQSVRTVTIVVGGFWVNTWEMSGKGQFLQEVVSNDPYFRNPQFRRFLQVPNWPN